MKKKGFTLIELLVVIAVIGLLSSIVLVSLGGVRKRARDARRRSDIRQISLAMEMCLDDSACGNSNYIAIAAAAPGRLTTTAIGTWMFPIPLDPGGGGVASTCAVDDGAEMTAGGYCGCTSALGAEYCIFAKLSNGDWFAASEKGVVTTTGVPSCLDASTPTGPDCW